MSTISTLTHKPGDFDKKSTSQGVWVVEVVFDLKLFKPLTYLIKKEDLPSNPLDLNGFLVAAFVRKSLKCGVIVSVKSIHKNQLAQLGYALKTIHQVISPYALFRKDHLIWLKKVADFFHQPLGQVVFLSLHPKEKKLSQAKLWFQSKREQALEKLKNPLQTQAHSSHFNQTIKRQDGIALTLEQSNISKALLSQNPQFSQSSLDYLYGQTGSGKTEVYLDIVEQALLEGKQVLFLVPEISLIRQTAKRLERAFGGLLMVNSQPFQCAQMHSKMTESQKQKSLLAIESHSAHILLATRSGVFARFDDLGCVVVDEEHDSSYRQTDQVHYQAIKALLLRQQSHPFMLLLGSATPSFALKKAADYDLKVRWHTLNRSHKQTPKSSSVEVVDSQMVSFSTRLSQPLNEAIVQALEQKQQVLLFLNRRGFSTHLECQKCQWFFQCSDCSAALSFHTSTQKMHCHHCERRFVKPNTCPQCGSGAMVLKGFGVQRLEEELKRQFPDTAIWRFDSDQARDSSAFDELWQQIEQGKSGIIIGTQMMSKGHDFHQICVVGFLNFDFDSLENSDLGEANAQLLIQVLGRAMRGEQKTKLIIQTSKPQDPNLLQLIEEGYDSFSKKGLVLRKKNALPPFSHLAMVKADGVQKNEVVDFLSQLRQKLLDYQLPQGLEVWQIQPAFIEKKNGRFRYTLTLFCEQEKPIHQVLHLIHHHLVIQIKTSPSLRWHIAMEPYRGDY